MKITETFTKQRDICLVDSWVGSRRRTNNKLKLIFCVEGVRGFFPTLNRYKKVTVNFSDKPEKGFLKVKINYYESIVTMNNFTRSSTVLGKTVDCLARSLRLNNHDNIVFYMKIIKKEK